MQLIDQVFHALNKTSNQSIIEPIMQDHVSAAAQDLLNDSKYLNGAKFDFPVYTYKTRRFTIYSFDLPLYKKTWTHINDAFTLLETMHGTLTRPIEICLKYSRARKTLPLHKNYILTSAQVNSGVSVRTSMVCVIYRLEEMHKVILHELLHLWLIDVAFDESKDREIEQRLNLRVLNNSSIRLGEAYTDTFACLYLAAMRVYAKGQTIDAFQKRFNHELNRVKSHIFNVANKIIHFYQGKPWVEGTHVFSYYIAKALVFQNLDKFDQWISKQSNNGQGANYYEFIGPLCQHNFRHILALKPGSSHNTDESPSDSVRMMPIYKKIDST